MKDLKEALENPNLFCISGSRLYGTYTENSDIDYRGFTIPPFDYLVGIRTFDQGELEGYEDAVVHSLQQFIKLLLKGDPQVTELMFVPEDKVVNADSVARKILDNKDVFLSQAIRRRLMGFSYSEHRKATAQKLVKEKVTHSETEQINMLFNKFPHLEKDDRADIKELCLSDKEEKLVSSFSGLGGKRRRQYEKYGMCVSSATHSLRLLGELKEFLTTGHITFPRPDAETLKKVRYGEVNKDEYVEMWEELKNDVDSLSEEDIIVPKHPDKEKAWSLYRDIVSEYLKENYFNG